MIKITQKRRHLIMGIRRLALLAAIVASGISFSQTDSTMFVPDVGLPDGVFLTYEDLRHNRPVTKEQIVSKLEKEQLEFITKTMFEEKFSFKRNDSIITRNTKSTWGFVQNKTFYIIYKDDYYRIPVFGCISYLVANVTVVNTGFYDPRFGYSDTGSSREIREFLVYFYDGKVVEFTLEYFETLLSKDKELSGEFHKLSKRKQKEQLYRFIRRYNERHPVYFLK